MNADGSGQINLTAALTDGSQFTGPVWSPDGTEIALSRHPDCYESGLITIAADGSGETGVYCNYDARNLSWQSSSVQPAPVPVRKSGTTTITPSQHSGWPSAP